MENILKSDGLTLGVCYYPEHWPETMWREDLRRMKEAGIGTVRVGEFSWNLMEPEDGVFTFEFWDGFLELAQEEGMRVIFGTPTATPPAWLSRKHPEILNCDENGQPFMHGARRHYNYNSRVYREYVKRIVTVLAKRYGKHPALAGWQIDNELNCERNEFYSEADDQAFRRFLREKYGTIERLNEAWGTRFWNQTYTDWSMLQTPKRVPGGAVNPHLKLDYFRFVSESARSFARLQSDILRSYSSPDVFITTNGMFGNLDNHRMTEESLDFLTYDSYPDFAFDLSSDPLHSADLNDRKWSRNLTEVRSVSPVFGIMEQQSGANGWNCGMEAPAPKPGQLKLWTMQSVAHGADFVSYFRWRTCTAGTEIYWHGILDYNNRDNRRLAEVREVRDCFAAAKEVAQSRYEAGFAVLKDYDNLWDSQTDRWHGRLEKASQEGIFRAAQLTHTPMDVLYLREGTALEQLQKYPVLFYPHPAIMTQERASLLEAYVKEGGRLVLGGRSGYKEENGKCVMLPEPGLLAGLAGADVTDFTMVGPADGPNAIVPETAVPGVLAGELEAPVFCEILRPATETTEVLGRYARDYFRGEPALCRHPVGKGWVYLLATVFTCRNTEWLLSLLDIASPWEDVLWLPKECELAVRKKDGAAYYFVLNYGRRPADIFVQKPLRDVLRGETVSGKLTVPPYGAWILAQ